MIDNIREEIKRREILTNAIDTIIGIYYEIAPKKRLKRGQVQDEIFTKLGIVRNTPLCRLINERMKLRGARLVTCHGTNYYSGLTHLPSQCVSLQQTVEDLS